ncbi:hypothetical protein GGQ80_002461 [Sphingomonas jinjuensis]|uniref:Uncharacterized protein n=1 Tax=Sphingomonas jinjuensis TaxID=535907 RepID=A0A840FMN8_9SPHN|nr:hypothetical protein [Sphingomonas jinjuensis]MBB4154545.1 hypothetical protein [Sphingomonas jinjuensis]
MGRYSVTLDDGDQLVSGVEVDRDSLEGAVRENLLDAATMALIALENCPGRRTTQLRVEDLETGEWKLCLVTVSLSSFVGQRPRH